MAFCPTPLFALVQNILEPSCVYAKVGLFGEAVANFAMNPQAAYATYRKAVLLDPMEGWTLVERREVGKKLKLPLAERMTLLEQPPDAVKSHDDLTPLFSRTMEQESLGPGRIDLENRPGTFGESRGGLSMR
jgi:hypothetical protein